VRYIRKFVLNSPLSQYILRLTIHSAYSGIFHRCDLLPHFRLVYFQSPAWDDKLLMTSGRL